MNAARWLSALALLACHQRSADPAPAATSIATPTAAASSVAAAPAEKPTAPAPSALPICRADAGAEPLAELCAIGADASRAHFECKDPQPVNFCKKLVTWGCVTDQHPTVTFQASADSTGPAMKDGEQLSTPALIARFPRRGPLRSVTVQRRATDGESSAVVSDMAAKLTSFGCVESTKDEFDCGTWRASVKYYPVSQMIYLRAGEPGAYDCQ